MLQKQRLYSSKLNTNLTLNTSTDLRLKLCRKRLNKTKSVKYLGIKIDENLNWKIHLHDLAFKLSRANAVLAKLRHFVSNEILRWTYFAVFHSHLNCVCMHSLSIQKIPSTKLVYSPEKALRIMNFAFFHAHTTPLFKNFNLLKFADIINESCIFINNCFNKD